MTNLKEKIKTDIQTLKTLDLDIMPAKTFYLHILKVFLITFSSILLAQVVAAKATSESIVWQDYFIH